MSAPPDQQPVRSASDRAREILGSMKERRECFTDVLHSSRQAKAQTPLKSTALKPLFSQEESQSIAEKLNQSLQERRDRISRMASSSGVKNGLIKEVPYGHAVSVGGASPLPSLDTASTSESTVSGGSPDHSNSEHDHSVITSVPPTLEDIREAFAEMGNSTSSSDDIEATSILGEVTSISTSIDASSSSSSSEEEFTPLDVSPAMLMADLDIPLSIIRSASSWDSVRGSMPANRTRSIRNVGSWDSTRGSERPLEQIRFSSSWDTSKSTGMPSFTKASSQVRTASPVSTASPASSLGTREECSLYVEALYSQKPNKGEELSYSSYLETHSSTPSSRRSTFRTSLLSPSRVGFRSTRRSQTQMSHASSLSSQSSYTKGPPPRDAVASWRALTPLNDSIPVGTREDRFGYLQAAQAKLERKQLKEKEMELSPRSISSNSDVMDLSVVVKDHEVRRKLLHSLQRSVNTLAKGTVPRAPSPLTVDGDEIIISDESSYDGTTDSNTSGWMTDDSPLQDSLLEYNSDEDLAEVSLLPKLLPPAAEEEAEAMPYRTQSLAWWAQPKAKPANAKNKANSQASKVNGSKDKLSVEPVLFVSEATADSNCEASGGLYCIALLSGLTDKTPIHVKVVIKKPQSNGLRLSNNFRCGANGSHYDLALRSGMDLSKPSPIPIPEEGEDMRYTSKGGLYDLAVRSGLKESIAAGTPYTVTATFPEDEDEATVASERRTDYDCGATGSLFLAMESGAAYETLGSLFYVAKRSGLML